ncbi:unnamed protein product [Rhizopus microsporus]
MTPEYELLASKIENVEASISEVKEQLAITIQETRELKSLLQSVLNALDNRRENIQPTASSPVEQPVTEKDDGIMKNANERGGKRLREPAQVRAFLKEALKLGDNDEQALAYYKRTLNLISRVVCETFYKHITDNRMFESAPYWSEIPMDVKKPFLDKMEKKATKAGIPIDKCENQWVALALMSKTYQTNYNPKTKSVKLLEFLKFSFLIHTIEE